MSITSNTYVPRGTHQPRGRRPWCASCDTDRHLTADSVTIMDPRQETLAAAISCTECGHSHVVATTAAFLAAIPGWDGDSGGSVRRDGAYRHCREPMSAVDPVDALPKMPSATSGVA